MRLKADIQFETIPGAQHWSQLLRQLNGGCRWSRNQTWLGLLWRKCRIRMIVSVLLVLEAPMECVLHVLEAPMDCVLRVVEHN